MPFLFDAHHFFFVLLFIFIVNDYHDIAFLKPIYILNSQGGVKFPTGGVFVFSVEKADEPASARCIEVSRSGEKPEPTVIVRMRENEETPVSSLTGAICFGFDPS